ncbi:hypothetical protein IJI18_01315 [Candidatus Saccharibacteria bacterium]|nr:hypothetical protein [Candidatus Saccharibacteria bacterium]
MNQNTSVDNDLQKAIDDITKSTSGDPLFADPVATPAPAPVGPFPVATPGPMPPAPMPMPEPVAPAEPVSAPTEDIKPEPIGHEEDIEPTANPEPKAPFLEKEGMGINQVKEAALRELAPILSKLDVAPEQKFDIYKNVIDNYHDSSVIEPAYQAASKITDDRERGEALLYIIDSIDKM